MEHNGVHIEARNACTEAERVCLEMVERLAHYKVDTAGLVYRGHCYCLGLEETPWSKDPHHQCCKCGDVQRGVLPEAKEAS